MDFSSLTDWEQYLKILVGMFAMVDPIGATPVYLSATAGHTPEEQRRVARLASLTLLGTLALFLFLGDRILDVFGITLEAFQIAGGLLLLITAFGLMTGHGPDQEEPPEGRHLVGVVPIGIPLLAGPAGISAVIVFTHAAPSLEHDLVVLATLLMVAALTYLLFRAGPRLKRMTGHATLAAFDRIMGLIVAAIGVEFIIDGLGTHFPGWLG